MPKPGAGLAYFALVFGAGFALGAVRVPLLVPRLGVRLAELIEMPLMFVAIVLAARFVIRRFDVPATASARLAMGGLAWVLLVAAELVLAALLQGVSPRDYVLGRDPVSGSVYLAMLVLFAAMPFLLARRQRASSTSSSRRA
jgi:hypothetical protein